MNKDSILDRIDEILKKMDDAIMTLPTHQDADYNWYEFNQERTYHD